MKNYYLDPLKRMSEYSVIKECVDSKRSVLVTGCMESGISHFISGCARDHHQKVVVTFDAIKAAELCEDLKGLGEDVVLYPSKDLLFFSASVHGSLILKQRLEFVKKIIAKEDFTVVMTADAFLDKVMPLDKMKTHYLEIKTGDELEIDALRSRLVEMGYEIVETVENPGQAAIRGSIVDIYTLTDADPFRIDFWDTEVDTIKTIDVDTQRSVKTVDSLKMYPATEYFPDDKAIEEGIKTIEEELAAAEDILDDDAYSQLQYVVKEFLTQLDLDPKGVALDSFVDYFFDDLESLIDYFDDPIFFIDEPNRVVDMLGAVTKEFGESMSNKVSVGKVLPGQTHVIWDPAVITAKMDRFTKVMFSAISHRAADFGVDETVEIAQKNIGTYSGQLEMLVKDLEQYKKQNYSVVINTASTTRARNLTKYLFDEGVVAYFLDESIKENRERVCNPQEVMVVKGNLRKGFSYPDAKFVAISDNDIYKEHRHQKKKKTKYRGDAISGFGDLKIGDYVVHENHGLGIYRGIEKITADQIEKDYIKIEYKGGSFLYVLATQLDRIQKYADADAKQPKLNRLGSPEWNKTKTRVKKAVDEIADELVELYYKRDTGSGFKFSPDNQWQQEFEELFEYEETDDQLNAIREVKRDMESSKIMDRLICGDVGFGKTEVALRAAFKAVQDGKQVAYLVPTTVLCGQHYKTFVARFRDFPVRVEMLSRFRSKSSIDSTIRDLKNGKVDIVIGTHRLLSKDVKFKDLGLLIIDEEQRFGVKHKEKIKEMKTNVDVITLTATPIPRTLHMSLIGVRDMSVMAEPPQDRMPIQTYVMEYDLETIRDAVSRELARGGQVFYVFNNIEKIAQMASRIQNKVPYAKVAFAHGQMSERQLEDIMYDFVNGNIDVLVSTTIIETGIDIPNANTIIIHNADKMGLSQLYQLRGRVGRSNRVAYAFMLYERQKILTEVAEKRLAAIKGFTELGSGVKIAMRDLEIRGAGNILGASQSGHLGEVGYELYCKMLEDSISVKKGEKPKEDFETKIDISVDAYVPADYIRDESVKMDMYKRISNIESNDEYYDMRDELEDRFGEIPTTVDNLMRVVLIKAKAHESFVTEIKGNSDKLELFMWDKAEIAVERIPILVREYKGKLRFVNSQRPHFEYRAGSTKGVIDIINDLLDDLSTLRG